MTRVTTATDQRLKAPVLHAMNNRKLVMTEFTAVYCHDQTKLKQSIGYLLAKSIVGFKFEHRSIEARLTSLFRSWSLLFPYMCI